MRCSRYGIICLAGSTFDHARPEVNPRRRPRSSARSQFGSFNGAIVALRMRGNSTSKLDSNSGSPEQLLHLHVTPDRPCAERCREITSGRLSSGRLSGQGRRLRSSDHSCKIAAGEASIPQTGGHVSGPCVRRRARERSIAEKDRENDMTAYPVDFHRRSEQKWALRAHAAIPRASKPQAARVGQSQRGHRESGRSEARDILGGSPWLSEIGRWLRAGYDAVDHSVPPHLAALVKELKRRHR
jgi:hypothetical protein